MPTKSDTTAISDIATQGLNTALGGAPSSGDDVVVGENNVYTASGGQNMGTNLNSLTWQASQRGDATGIKFNCTGGNVYFGGGGRNYSGSSIGSAAVWLNTIFDLASNGRFDLSDVTLTTARIKRGDIRVGADGVVTTAYCTGGSLYLVPGTAATTIEVSGDAALNLQRDVGTLRIQATGKATIDSTTCTPTLVEMQSKDCSLTLKRCGTITALGVAAGGAKGTLDLSTAAYPVTVSTLYESSDLTIILPRHNPDVLISSSPNTANGLAQRILR